MVRKGLGWAHRKCSHWDEQLPSDGDGSGRRRFGPFDAVVCSLGVFFAEDMAALLRSLFGLLRPGGRFAAAVFGEHVFDPMRRVFVETLGELAPDVEVLQPWRRTEDASTLRGI